MYTFITRQRCVLKKIRLQSRHKVPTFVFLKSVIPLKKKRVTLYNYVLLILQYASFNLIAAPSSHIFYFFNNQVLVEDRITKWTLCMDFFMNARFV